VPVRGVGSATVPGAVAGWTALAERFGTRSLDALAAPAIGMARDGVERAPGLVRVGGWMREHLDAEARRIFLADGPLVQPELATVLEDLGGFSSGPVAQRAPAPFTPADFAAHRAYWVEVERARFPGRPDVEICELPPPSRGHLVLAALRRLEPLDGLGLDDPELHGRLLRALQAVVHPGGDTIYLCAVDGRGMAVSLSQSLAHPFGSCIVVPGTGVLLHNRGSYHTPETYRGGAVPVHTLAPAMALSDGRPRVVLGTMGGEAQIQIHLQLLVRLLLHGATAQDAVAAPRWIFDQTTLWAEPGLPSLEPVPGGLVQRVLEISELAGHAHVIALDGNGLDAGCDPRADGVALGD
jgi:gamma-glutamyltranspeptidase/glutathione hydrolase